MIVLPGEPQPEVVVNVSRFIDTTLKVIVSNTVNQRCPTIFLCSPYLWQINTSIPHMVKNVPKIV